MMFVQLRNSVSILYVDTQPLDDIRTFIAKFDIGKYINEIICVPYDTDYLINEVSIDHMEWIDCHPESEHHQIKGRVEADVCEKSAILNNLGEHDMKERK